MESILCEPTTPEHIAYPGVWFIYQILTPMKKMKFFLSQMLSAVNSFLVRGGLRAFI